MKGLVFNIVEQVVEEQFGPDTWDRTLELAGVDGAYTSLGNYDDAELVRVVGALTEVLRLSRHEVLVATGRNGFPILASRHDYLLAGMTGWREVLSRLDDLIHPEVRKIYPDAQVPRFGADESDGVVRLVYESARDLCSLAEGLVLGLGDWYDSILVVDHCSCVQRGDDQCVFEVRQT